MTANPSFSVIKPLLKTRSVVVKLESLEQNPPQPCRRRRARLNNECESH